MMILHPDKTSPVPMFIQLLEQIRKLADEGHLAPGYRLPSSRALAASLGVNRSTVVRVYEELWALGYTESHSGSYTVIRKRSLPARVQGVEKDAYDSGGAFAREGTARDIRLSSYIKEFDVPKDSSMIDFRTLSPDLRLIDKPKLLDCCRHSMASPEASLGYSPPAGYGLLRIEIAAHMKRHGIEATPEEVMITGGSQYALYLIFRTFSRPGDRILIESPGYQMLFPLLDHFKLVPLEVPVGRRHFDSELLEKMASENPVKFIYTIPSFQNPTGATLDAPGRELLLRLCQTRNIHLIEDSIEEELKYSGRVHLPVKAMDRTGNVIYLGTFSKVLAPGLRTGWIIASPPLVRALSEVRTMIDLSSSSFTQLMLAHYCRSGYYELHLRKIMRTFRKRMQILQTSLRTMIPAGELMWDEPLGGYLVWLKVNRQLPLDAEDYFARFGVMVSSGGRFFLHPPPETFLRICISGTNGEEIREGVRRLAEGLKALSENTPVSL